MELANILNVLLQGITTYFSDNCELKDAELAQKFLTEKVSCFIDFPLTRKKREMLFGSFRIRTFHSCLQDLSPYNSRLFKFTEDDKTVYEVRLASVNTSGVNESFKKCFFEARGCKSTLLEKDQCQWSMLGWKLLCRPPTVSQYCLSTLQFPAEP